MLVLSRKVGERVMIADGIIIQVLEIRGRQIRLGFEAPPEVAIRREELPVGRGPASAGQGAVRRPR
jgi:carbon storage regulator